MEPHPIAELLPPPGPNPAGESAQPGKARLVTLTAQQVRERIQNAHARLMARHPQRSLIELIENYSHTPWEYPELELISENIWLAGGSCGPRGWAAAEELRAWEQEILSRVR